MKIKKQDLIKYIIIGVIILIVFSLVIALLGENKREVKLDLNKVTNNYTVDDRIIMMLYKRYNPERELLFNLIGSNNKKDYYGYFYKNKKVNYEDLDDVIKNTILLNDADYRTGEYNEEDNCYYMKLDGFKVIYKKLFGKEDYKINFDDNNYVVDVDVLEDKICIGNKINSNYDTVIDTYMVNGVKDKDTISIYERVAFIEMDDKYLYFYKDYQKKKLVYKLKVTDKLDRSFINNSEVTSNILIEYQNEFDLYEYTYVKGEDSYYFESVER